MERNYTIIGDIDENHSNQSINSVSHNNLEVNSISNRLKRLNLDVKDAVTKTPNENNERIINSDTGFEENENDYIEELVRSKEWNQLVKNSTSYVAYDGWTFAEKRAIKESSTITSENWFVNRDQAILPFKNQRIEEIRKNGGKMFKDEQYPAGIGLITNSATSECAKYLFKCFTNCSTLSDLDRQIKWASCKIIPTRKNQPNVKAAFVLDRYGKPPNDPSNLNEYLDCFSVHDIFQGAYGDCYFIATLLSVTKNRDLVAHLMPIDNALERNMSIGAYHFRLWSLGDWYDVVVDDELPLNLSNDPLFCKNQTYFNENWAPLLEKATFKFTGQQLSDMWGGYLEDIGTLLSGGFGDTYSTEIASTISSHKVYAISSRSRVYYDSLTSYNNLGLHPNVDELFNIIETAIKQNNLVGTFSTYDNICKQKTYVYNHQYAITEAFVSKSTRIVKLQNPWNRLEDYTKQAIHKSLVSLHNLPATLNGER